jgi:predicted permease
VATTGAVTAAAVQQRALEAVAALPGVTRAAGSTWIPLGTGGGGLLTDARGRRPETGKPTAFNFVSPGWFATYGTPLHAGREFEERDGEGAPRVAVVNEALRRTLLGNGRAVGETIHAGPCGRTGCTVVGVVADTVYGRSLRDSPPPTVYVPLAQSTTPPGAPLRISVRAAGDVARLVPGLAAALSGVHPGLTFSFKPLDLEVETALGQERLLATLAGFFAATALLLSAIGLYGVTSHAVTRRRTEIGIRMALGGQPRGVLGAMLKRVAWSVVVGTFAGLFAALWLSRFVAPLLYGLAPNDPVTLGASAMTLILVAAVAASVPATRAMRIDPAQVLRQH